MNEPKKITVVGATGLIGRQLVPLLSAAGHAVVPASRSTGVDVVTGVGLDAAVAGADVVIDVINSPTPADPSEAFFAQAASNLSAVTAKSGVGHYVVLSIVGTDGMAAHAGYMRGKVAQETAAAHSGVPWTVVRATQFHELAEPITESLVVDGVVRAPTAMIQTVDSAEVAAIVARVSTGSAVDGIHDVGGPQRMSFGDMARAVLAHQRRDLDVIDDPEATYHGIRVDDTTLVPGPGAELGVTRLDGWLQRR